MKKIILGVFMSLGFFQSALALNIMNHSSLQTDCNGGTFPPITIYGTDTTHLWDAITTSQEGIISSSSEVSVYVRDNKVSIPNGWVQVSNYMPSSGQFYTAWNNELTGLNVSSLVPTDRDTPVAQVVYRIRRMLVGQNNTFDFGGDYVSSNFTDDIPVQVNHGSLNKKFDSSTFHVDNECVSIIPRWCGDGVVDSGREQCDFSDASQSGWGTGGCSTSCQPVSAQVTCTPGATTWAQAAAVDATTAGLCPESQTVWDFTSAVSGDTTNYTWSCNGSTVGGSCSASFTTSVTPPTEGGGWWGGGLTCTPGDFTRDSGWVVPSQISASTPGLCPVGETVGNFTDTLNGTSHSYSWSCNTISAGLACTAFFNGGGWGGGGGGWGWGGGGWGGGGGGGWPLTVPGSSSYCWNGVVERPNAAGQYENCDTTAAWCISCNIISTNPGAILPGKLIITTPGSSSMSIDTFKLIVWNQVPVFSVGDTVSFETDNPMYLENKATTITNQSSLISGSTISKTLNNVWVGGVIRFETPWSRTYDASGNLLTITYEQKDYPSSIVLFEWSELQDLKGDTSTIVSGSFDDTVLTNPTYRSQGLYASLQYLESPFNIRVSKPIIGNIAGWGAFVGSLLGYSVDTVVQSFMNNLRSGNFTTSTVNVASSYGLSSATSSVSDNNSLSQSITSWGASEAGRITNSSKNTSGIYTSTSIASEFEIDSKSTKLGDASNIRVFKDGDVSVDGNLDLAGVKTVIIENGNLIINKDIRYADKTSSFAFIVKQGNIIIADSVQNIAGVYVTLAGAIQSNGVSTPNRLMVDGSLYGNTSDLVNNRSYVRGQMDYTALNVGVIVNYSNRAIMYPPPSLSRFLDQYSMQRVAR